ncbi:MULTISPECIES: sensor histidine kinase [unclassified Streptomyces]|jgi:signal transduction histidine kinase|uniref:sensor histidine kinase n=1 Tax=unclassified Streptomyces TaxID=2593676 RepID=UPI0024756F17|nr:MULTISPECIES: sensor histidine kinase [unclassified Streptomyces]MDH6447617.1 signal transduction histidine kinase [Streptomyces sp. SAI-119]MDH6501660.1 signal transduction histidine kinase [Streptomyces sp. SAI-149]GLP64711.1 two-component sensor histidine kinase [Streptomyces sp. TUS-ST3]
MQVTAIRRWAARHDRIRDAFPALVLMIVAVGAAAAGQSGWHAPRAAGVAWTALSCVPLVFRSRRPLAVVGATLAVDLTAMAVVPDRVSTPAASLVALYTLATLSSRRTAWTVGVLAAVAISGVYAATHEEPLLVGTSLLRLDFAIAATALGDAVRSRRQHLARVEERAERAERTRETEARRRVTEERVRIARELHDVVAHHITLVNAQAGVAHHLLRTDPDRAYEALAHIKETSRAALDELRATVGLLRQPDDAPDSRAPLPGLADLDALIGGIRAGGLSVTVARTGLARPVAPATDLTAYRIIQESLTNTHKHARAAHADVTLDYGAATLRVTVTDDGRSGAAKGPGTGHGLIGMRERATAIGGTLSCGRQPGGGFEVVAELPLSLTPATA